jgi:hypothetical protein
MLKDRPLGPKDELIQAVEYSAKHPQLYDVLQLESTEMSLFEYYCLDVLLAFILLFILLIVSTWRLIYLTKKLVRLFSKKQLKTKNA